jgi:uncharacterized Rmd1/YagE family protein
MSQNFPRYNNSDQENEPSQLTPLLGNNNIPSNIPKKVVKSPLDTLRLAFANNQKRQYPISDYGALTRENLENRILKENTSPSQIGKVLEMKAALSVDDFGETNSIVDFKLPNQSNKTIRSGRQRKKSAARSKGGEFQARRKKRRIYFCSIGSEIDVEGLLADKFLQTSFMGLRGKMYSEVLHLYMENIPNTPTTKDKEENPQEDTTPLQEEDDDHHHHHHPSHHEEDSVKNPLHGEDEEERKHDLYTIDEQVFTEDEDSHHRRKAKQLPPLPPATRFLQRSHSDPAELDGNTFLDGDIITDNEETPRNSINIPRELPFRDDGHHHHPPIIRNLSNNSDNPHKLPTFTPTQVGEDEIVANTHYWSNGGREVFVFDFGALVFWGYHRDEVKDLLRLFREYVVKGKLSDEEFKVGEDDMAFVLSPGTEEVTISNDVVTLNEFTAVKSRLAVSFAIAQSAILSVFEGRIEDKIEDYKYIPETLALSGKINLSARQLGNMIGEVFVIRHDVNLHNEILNIPDYFWKENSVEPLYRMTSLYLEMEPRTEVLNKRLDLLRELLKLLQHQHENSHNIKLEWIIIWLIVACVVLEGFVLVGKVLKLWD